MSSELRLYNTLTRSLEPFVPRVAGQVQLYVCGPTVYDIAHAGNARSAVVFDVLVRHLRWLGYRVTYVRNITDVDDKILDRARETGEPPLSLSSRMAPIYQADMRTLNCLDPTHEPKVSENIDEIIHLIETLVAGGHAYEATMPSTGVRDVYFSVKSFPGYGKLSRRNLDELEIGARIEPGEGKRDPLDFALWKGAVGDAWGWESPWGRGRPGWHIECSAMSTKYLGYGFDLHGGGMDLIFPHHENEIAQSEAAHPDAGPFARMWMHNGFLNIDKEKMSKSLGNLVKPRDVSESNDPEALRYLFLGAHYRGPLGLDLDKLPSGRVVYPGVDEAERRIDYMYATLDRLADLAKSASGSVAPAGAVSAEPAGAGERRGDAAEAKAVPKELEPYRKTIDEARDRARVALNDDLNTPAALAVLAELATASNELCDGARKRRKDERAAEAAALLAGRAAAAIRSIADVLGLLQTPREIYEQRTRERRLRARGLSAADIEAMVAERAAARAAKDFARADAIRKELDAAGIEVFDGPEGTSWKVKI